jgi:hypothetical protein
VISSLHPLRVRPLSVLWGRVSTPINICKIDRYIESRKVCSGIEYKWGG